MSLLDKIKFLCKEKAISVYELEEKLGFGRNTIYQWNKRTPGWDKVKLVVDFFNVSIDYLIGRETPGIDDRSQLIAAHIDEDVSDEQMKEILQFIEFIKTKHNM